MCVGTYVYNEILPFLTRCMDLGRGHYAKWNKMKTYTEWFHLYLESKIKWTIANRTEQTQNHREHTAGCQRSRWWKGKNKQKQPMEEFPSWLRGKEPH